MLPFPGRVGVGEFPLQREGEVDLGEAFPEIVVPQVVAFLQVVLQTREEGARKGDLAILVAFASSHGQEAAMEVDVADAHLQELSQPQSAAVLDGEEEIPRSLAVLQKTADLGGSDHGGETSTSVGVAALLEDQLHRQNPGEQHGQRVARLGDGGRGEVAGQGEMTKEILDRLRSLDSVAGNLGHVVREASAPIEIGLDGPRAVPLRPEPAPHSVQDLLPGTEDGRSPGRRGRSFLERQPVSHGLIRLTTLPSREAFPFEQAGVGLGLGPCGPRRKVPTKPVRDPPLVIPEMLRQDARA